MNHGMFAAVQDHFRENGVKFGTMDGHQVLMAGFANLWGGFHCLIQVEEETGTVQVHTEVPMHVPVVRRLAMAEFLTRANFGLRIGNFEMDMRDGQVRYKTSICVGDCPFSSDFMTPLMQISLSTTTRYMPGLIAVVHENAQPEQAIAGIEDAMGIEQEESGESVELQDSEPEASIDRLEAAFGEGEQEEPDGPDQDPLAPPKEEENPA